ncbi:MAG TPA: Asp-tRNA(Asn)/Glu-tRNA(Gln) amidotransferase subunit GatB, partial [Candidatus Methylacidiphilales bacterium]|nr:Asp-tRNA(Asn)/Glu-tRNA(Gln) amidotransferase subunit GatB [Candidatus Methylacidiphilales bacterium]
SLTAADYEAVIGLEVHVQLKTKSKMFCCCKIEFGGAVNSHVCPVCLGLPGVLPVPNEEAIIKTILTGEMLGCQIATRCKFDRKNYFYPDMPKNYQISQYDEPLCRGGTVRLDLMAYPKDAQKDPATSADKAVRLVRIHLEEDVAKSFHFEDGTSGIDFNRAGTPLMEIVSEADMSSPEEAFAYLSSLKQILIYGDVSDADMEKGQMRCDVNVSVRPRGQKEFGTKCELKNLNSISGVRRALKYEIARQIDVVASGGKIEQQTRRWDDDKGETTLMRTKEQAHDYRYFPDPDIHPVRTDEGLYEEAQSRMPELPAAKKLRLALEYSLTAYQAGVLAADAPLADYFEKAAKPKPANGPAIANFLLNDYLAIAQAEEIRPKAPAFYFTELAELSVSGKINSRQAKEVFAQMVTAGKSPTQLVKELGLEQVSDVAQLEAFCDQAIAANPKSVADFKAGKQNAVNALKGQVMKLSKGTANPQLVGEILLKKLSA